MRGVDGPTSSGPDQRAAALAWAATTRDRRELVRDDLRAGRVALLDVLAQRTSDSALGAVRLLWVLESVPGARKVDTRRRLSELGIDASTPLASVGDELVATLVAEFAEPVRVAR